MAGKFEKKPSIWKRIGSALIWILLVTVLVGGIFLLVNHFMDRSGYNPEHTDPYETSAPTETTAETTEETTIPEETTVPEETTAATTAPTEPYVVATASIGASGDVLPHLPVINSVKSNGQYDFSGIFTYVKDYFNTYDYMVVNLEVPLAGADEGYSGYPEFNSPDSIADALKEAGVDMVLTANNHTYDQRRAGMIRTMEVLKQKGLDYTGTRTSTEESVYQVCDINGIKVGMVCYTYDTTSETSGRVSLNGIPLKNEDAELVNSFDYTKLAPFYEEFEGVLEDMREEGAEAIIAFIHWGYEYYLSPVAYQKAMAQKLCDMGVDVIVGGHPHVLEPFDTLTSENGNTTYCLYSTGNLLSNQRRDTLSSVENRNYTEDGVIFGVTFQKWNDGTVEISKLDATPTWVSKEYRGGKNVYTLIPLDTDIPDWDSYFAINDKSFLKGSYKRTMSIIGEGLNEALTALGLEPLPLTYE